MQIEWEEESLCVNIQLRCPYRTGVDLFFYEMVTKWLVPNTRLEPFAFEVHREGQQVRAGIKVCMASPSEKALAEKNFPFLQREIEVGARSFYHASKILEMKGLSRGDRVALVQQKLSRAIARFPGLYDFDLYTTFHQLLVSGKVGRASPRHIAEMAKTLYRFERELESKRGGKRSLLLRYKRRGFVTPLGIRQGITLFGGMHRMHTHELFEERHLIAALRQVFPDAEPLPNSFFRLVKKGEHLTFAIDIAVDGDLSKVTQELPMEIRARIEHLVPPVFMPRNEEEVLRTIVTLSKEITSIDDLPQVNIAFKEQTPQLLSFTVVLVRPKVEESSLLSLFPEAIFDQLRMLNLWKEAAVFRVDLPSEDFLRKDFSVDLFAARGRIVKAVEAKLGEVRDFNGGMIAKQREQFASLSQLLGPMSDKHRFLLQSFFHALHPATVATTLSPDRIKEFFLLFLHAFEDPQESSRFERGECVIGKGEERAFGEGLVLDLCIFDTHFTGCLTFAEKPSYS